LKSGNSDELKIISKFIEELLIILASRDSDGSQLNNNIEINM
jgi:hypothetical protein